MTEVTLKTVSLSFGMEEQAWVEKRLAEGRHIDVGDLLRDLIRRDQEGLPLAGRAISE